MADSEKLKSLFPHGSPSFFELNSEASGPEPQRAVRHEPLGKKQRKASHTGRCFLRYTTYRCQRLDPDNWCTKFFTDALRYCGAIPDDTEEEIRLVVIQKKVYRRKDEKTLIELIYLDE